MTRDPMGSPFADIAIEPRIRTRVELLVFGLVLEAALRGEELGIEPVTLPTSDSEARRETAIPRLVHDLACELGIAPVDVERRICRYFTDYEPGLTVAADPQWLPPRVWPFADPGS